VVAYATAQFSLGNDSLLMRVRRILLVCAAVVAVLVGTLAAAAWYFGGVAYRPLFVREGDLPAVHGCWRLLDPDGRSMAGGRWGAPAIVQLTPLIDARHAPSRREIVRVAHRRDSLGLPIDSVIGTVHIRTRWGITAPTNRLIVSVSTGLGGPVFRFGLPNSESPDTLRGSAAMFSDAPPYFRRAGRAIAVRTPCG
jgi:hypothetical protein